MAQNINSVVIKEISEYTCKYVEESWDKNKFHRKERLKQTEIALPWERMEGLTNLLPDPVV